MHIDDQTYKAKNGKIYRRVLLRNSYRVDGKIKHDTIANLTKCSDEEIEAIKFAIKHKGELGDINDTIQHLKTRQGQAIGAVWTLLQIARQLNICKALGSSREAKLVLWLIMSSLMNANSRLSAVRLAARHAVCDVLGLDEFNEDDLYAAMDWLDCRQGRIEKALFRARYGNRKPILYLYDVTSTYMEGVENLLAMFGYNRDGKKGKMQLVIGLLTDEMGWPISIQVFDGNTNDFKTVGDQITKLTDRFGVEKAIFVGDRGMIKSGQITDLCEADFYHITAITKSQIESLIKQDIFQIDMFEDQLCEVIIFPDSDSSDDGVADMEDDREQPTKRYILRRNPQRAREIESSRQGKLTQLQNFVDKRNCYLSDHPKASVSKALRDSMDKAASLKVAGWATVVEVKNRYLAVEIDEVKKAHAARLDGCYVLTSNVPSGMASAAVVHDRYKDLKEVEWAFRTMKTTLIEMRGVFVRTKPHTRAHVFIVMLAYQLAYHLRRKWVNMDLTVEEGLDELASIDTVFIDVKGVECQRIPEPRGTGRQLLKALNVILPDAIPHRNIKIEPRKKIKEVRRNVTCK